MKRVVYIIAITLLGCLPLSAQDNSPFYSDPSSSHAKKMADVFKSLSEEKWDNAYKKLVDIEKKSNKEIEKGEAREGNTIMDALAPLPELAYAILEMAPVPEKNKAERPARDLCSAYKRIKLVENSEEYRHVDSFLSLSKGNTIKTSDVIAKIEMELWQETKSVNSIKAYETLLGLLRPQSSYKSNIEQEYEQLVYDDVLKDSDIERCVVYLKRFEGIATVGHKQDVVDHRDRLAYAGMPATVEGMRRYIREYPSSKLLGEAKSRLYEYAFQGLSKTSKAYQAYIEEFPESSFLKMATDSMYFYGYKEADAVGTIRAYDDFCKNFPNAPQIAEAMKKRLEAKEKEKMMVMEFIKDFYNTRKFYDDDFLREHCSASMKKILRDAFEYDCDPDDECFEGTLFRTGYQDVKPNIDQNGNYTDEGVKDGIIKITPLNDNWYNYEFYDMGWMDAHNIKIIVDGDKCIIDDLKRHQTAEWTEYVDYSEWEGEYSWEANGGRSMRFRIKSNGGGNYSGTYSMTHRYGGWESKIDGALKGNMIVFRETSGTWYEYDQNDDKWKEHKITEFNKHIIRKNDDGSYESINEENEKDGLPLEKNIKIKEHSNEMTEGKVKNQNYLPDTNENIEEEKEPEDIAKEAYVLVNNESHDKIEKKYCTRDWNDLKKRYKKLEEDLGEELMDSGCDCYDSYSWIEGQDPGDLYEVIESIRYKEIEPNKVWVKVKLQGFYIVDGEKIVGPLQSTILVMKKEDNEWKIDDLRHESEGQFYSIKDGMENCLKEYGY